MTGMPPGPPGPPGPSTPSTFQHRHFQQPWPEGAYRLFQLGFVVDDLTRGGCRVP
ncbi:hypothetical protein [Pseudofrankia asymbiotica]|uniref:hypothetical protein n=1 Tax=Pseudofrankia asymbiotica TaxID=1834516 RepID=UPI0013047281|nr:hypothetical protein [Pseudofrankia asymbiotica]